MTQDGMSDWMTYNEEFQECVVLPGKLCTIKETAVVRCEPPATCSRLIEEHDDFKAFIHCTSRSQKLIYFQGIVTSLPIFNLLHHFIIT